MLFALLAQMQKFPPPSSAADSGPGIFGLLGFLCCTLIPVLLVLAYGGAVVAGLWKIFEKAGKPGWAALVPIYNLMMLVEIAGKPPVWAFLMLIPCANIYWLIMTWISVAKSFGKSDAFGIGLALGVCVPLLGFSDARYQGPAG